MTLTTQTALGQHSFVGPFTNNNQIPSLSGVYLITTIAQNGGHTIIDVGESEDIHHRISNHDRTAQWRQNAQNGLHAWILAANEAERMLVEHAHRMAYDPVCGER